MAGLLTPDRQMLRCPARVHAILDHGRFLRMRCKDASCPEVQWGKERGLYAYHVFDLETGRRWTDYEPDPRRKEQR